MSLKKYIRWQIKQWLPLFIISILLMSSFFLLTTFIIPVDNYFPIGDSIPSKTNYTFITILYIISLFICIIFAIFVYDYRLKKRQVDIFMQVPFSQNSLRITRILIGLAMILISFSLIYCFGISILYIRQFNLVSEIVVDGVIQKLVYYNGLYFFLAYIYLVINISIFYFIMCLIVSFADSILDALILIVASFIILFFSEALLLFCFYTFSLYQENTLLSLALNCLSYSPLSLSIFTFVQVFEPLIISLPSNFLNAFNYPEMIGVYVINSILYLAFLGLAIYILFFKKDPSGEYAGKGGSRNFPISLILHYAIFNYGLLTTFLNSIPDIFFVVIFCINIIFYGVIYYCILSLYNRSFKMNKQNLIVFLVNICLVLAIGIAYSIIFFIK